MGEKRLDLSRDRAKRGGAGNQRIEKRRQESAIISFRGNAGPVQEKNIGPGTRSLSSVSRINSYLLANQWPMVRRKAVLERYAAL
eukprot:2456016-Prymnesium_polylepis.1